MHFARLTRERLPFYVRCVSQPTTRSHPLVLTTKCARCLMKLMIAEPDTPFARLAHERLCLMRGYHHSPAAFPNRRHARTLQAGKASAISIFRRTLRSPGRAAWRLLPERPARWFSQPMTRSHSLVLPRTRARCLMNFMIT